MAGWSLYLDAGRPTFHYNWFGHVHTSVATAAVLGAGRHRVVVEFASDGGFGAGGEVLVSVDGAQEAHGRIERTVPLVFSMSGETFDVAVDTGSPVGPYPHRFPCTATVIGVTLERLDEPAPEVLERVRAGRLSAGLSTQ
jgi:arylsulfatase